MPAEEEQICLTLGCQNVPIYYIDSKKKYCCNLCANGIYYDLECVKMVTRDEIEETMAFLKTFLESAQEKFDLVRSPVEAKEVLLEYDSKFRALDEELKVCIDKQEPHKFEEILAKVRGLRCGLKKDQNYIKLVIMYTDTHHLMDRRRISYEVLAEVPRDAAEVLTQEVTRLARENRRLREEIERLKEEADKAKVEVINRREFNAMYKECIGQDFDLNSSTTLNIDCSKDEYINLMKKL
jgi:hypothetical protein